MADLTPERREELARKFNTPCPKHGHHTLEVAPNEDLPNPKDFDFHCPSGHLYDAGDAMGFLLRERRGD